MTKDNVSSNDPYQHQVDTTTAPTGSHTWHPTMNLRWLEKVTLNFAPTQVLQQQFISNTGEREWRDVITEEE